jgi:CMP-N-acetylneuraminic acid synthetase
MKAQAPGPVWAIIPARGGSKSIPFKNIALLAGRPMLDYGVLAARESAVCDRIIGSTDDDSIAARFRHLGVEVDIRPNGLGEDDTPVVDVVRDLVRRYKSFGAPWLVVLVQPTSPFLLPSHLEGLVKLMAARGDAKSGQTVAQCPHNHHEWNQREVSDGIVDFVHAAERQRGYNKQTKPDRWVFGNLLATTARAIEAGEGLFVSPSAAYPIEQPYDFDVDGALDLRMASMMIDAGMVNLPHVPPRKIGCNEPVR